MCESFVDRIKPNDSAIGTYLEALLSGSYQIPTFQRDVVWEAYNVKKLWDSIYKFYPLGSILIWCTKLKLQNHREIGGNIIQATTKEEFQYILDGQQRTTALLTSLHGGHIKNRNGFDPKLYIDLTVKLSGETDDESFKQRFLFWSEINDQGGKEKQNTERMECFRKGLIVPLQRVQQDYGKVEQTLYESGFDYKNHVQQNLRRIRDVFFNYRISFICLRGIQVGEVCQIFERINQAGMPLDIFDIVVAKTFVSESKQTTPVGEEIVIKPGFYLREVFDNFRDGIASSYRHIDNHTLLQMLAVAIRVRIPDSGVTNITDRFLNEIRTEQICKVWESTRKAILAAFDFFDNVLHLKGPELIPYRYLYMTCMAYFLDNQKPDHKFLETYFWYHVFHNDDLLTSTAHLWKHIEFLRKSVDGEAEQLPIFTIDRNAFRQAKYSSRGRYSRAILSLLANRKPRDWGNAHRDVLVEVYYSLGDKPNFHHVFPLGYIGKQPGTNKVDANSLMNIAYLTAQTNQGISDENPLTYMKNMDDGNEFRQVLEEHFVPLCALEWAYAAEMPTDALDVFIERRIDAIINFLREKMPEVKFNIIDTASVEVVTALNRASHPPADKLIGQGEGTKIEFKSTLRRNLHTGQNDARMENACLKTIAAFVNSKGGYLIVGVDDKGNALGIGADEFVSEDKMQLHLINLLKTSIGPVCLHYVEPRFEDYKGARVLVVECQPGRSPAYLRDGNKEHFYVRTGCCTTELDMSETQRFISERFLS